MIIFGFGHKSTKLFGVIHMQRCGNCNNDVERQLIRVTTWFTLFFIPIIPYRNEYLSVCPICKNTYAMSKEEFFEAAGNGEYSDGNARRKTSVSASGNANLVPKQNQYAGKTETQINFLKQMEELRAEKESNR